MGWNNYSSNKEVTEITDDIEDTTLESDYLGKDTISATANFDINIKGENIPIRDLTAEEEIVVRGPSLKTYDGLYILTNDKKFINVVRRDIDG